MQCDCQIHRVARQRQTFFMVWKRQFFPFWQFRQTTRYRHVMHDIGSNNILNNVLQHAHMANGMPQGSPQHSLTDCCWATTTPVLPSFLRLCVFCLCRNPLHDRPNPCLLLSAVWNMFFNCFNKFPRNQLTLRLFYYGVLSTCNSFYNRMLFVVPFEKSCE